MYSNKMLRIQDAVFVLPSRVDNLGQEILALITDRLAKGILDGRVITIDKVTVDKLHGER